MKLKKGSYKRDESDVGNGCNVYAKEMEVRLEGSFSVGKGIAEKLYWACKS